MLFMKITKGNVPVFPLPWSASKVRSKGSYKFSVSCSEYTEIEYLPDYKENNATYEAEMCKLLEFSVEQYCRVPIWYYVEGIYRVTFWAVVERCLSWFDWMW